MRGERNLGARRGRDRGPDDLWVDMNGWRPDLDGGMQTIGLTFRTGILPLQRSLATSDPTLVRLPRGSPRSFSRPAARREAFLCFSSVNLGISVC